MIIVIYAGYQSVPLNPNSLDTTGLGGTEQCIIYLANQFALDNHSVYVTGEVESINYLNVKYRNLNDLETELADTEIDWVIGVSYINYLLELDFLNFKKSFFWLHNTEFYPWFRGEEIENGGKNLLYNNKLTYIVCLTEWHKQDFLKRFPKVSDKTIVIGNGVETSNFVKSNKPKINNSFIYTSHAERGLQKVLEQWNIIQTKLPNATLHIATPEYGLEYFNENYLEIVNNTNHVKFHGTLPRKKLYSLMSKCQYWYYPTEYEETFCITAIEMLGHQVTPIATEVAALKETLSGFNLKSIDNFAKELDFKKVSEYIKNKDWKSVKNEWYKYILSMDNVKNKFELECVYVISLNVDQSLIDEWTNNIRKKLIPWYDGPIVCKKATNGLKVTNEWLEQADYAVYDNWKIENHSNDYWSRDVTPGELGCAISHHKIWKHANESNFKNILILEDDFFVRARMTLNVLSKLPKNYDLFYLGRNPNNGWQGNIYEDRPIGDGTLVIPAPSFNSHAYMLSANGVSKLLSYNFNKNLFAVDDFLIASSAGHVREDLSFIKPKLKSFGVPNDIVTQTRPSEDDGPRVDPLDDSPYLHPDLYAYYDDPDAWKQKFITYSARTQEWELIMDEPFDNCFSMPLFTQEFCEKIREEAEHSNKWTTDRHEYYPTTDMLLNDIEFEQIYYEVLREFVIPASIHAFQLEGRGWEDMVSEDFLAKYVPSAQGHLSLHHDHSNITALVTLSNFEEYEGGGTYFSHQKQLVKEKQGYVSIHPGNITHKHGARATTKGTRYIIVSFMKNSDFMK